MVEGSRRGSPKELRRESAHPAPPPPPELVLAAHASSA